MEIMKQQEAFQEDILSILDALGLGIHARPISPHQVVADEILPAIVELRDVIQDFSDAYVCNGIRGFDALIRVHQRATALSLNYVSRI